MQRVFFHRDWRTGAFPSSLRLLLVCLAVGSLASPACADPSPPDTGTGLVHLRWKPTATKLLLAQEPARTSGPALFRWVEFPQVFVLEFADRKAQSRAMNRIAAFVEKKGTRGRILDDRALSAFIQESGEKPENFYWAHDYRAADIGRFFATATRTTPRGPAPGLNQDERDLEAMLIHNGLLPVPSQGSQKVLLTIPRGIGPGTRRVLVEHELRHALYFIGQEYRNRCDSVWNALDRSDRDAITLTLSLQGYDPADSFLIRNEFQAFLLERTQTFSTYMRRVSARDSSGLLLRYLRDKPDRLEQIGDLLRARLGTFQLADTSRNGRVP